LALAPETVLPVGDGFGFHPSLKALAARFKAGQVAVVHGVGFADPNYSHFESMDIWQSGVPETPVSTGWLGRWLDGTRADPLQAVAIGPTVPPALSGERVQAVALPTGPLHLPGAAGEQRLMRRLGGPSGRRGLDAQAAGADQDLFRAVDTFGPMLDRSAGSAAAGAGSAGGLAIANGGGGVGETGILHTQLSMVANLILGGAPADVYSVELGGFDTHADQTPTQQDLLGQLDSALDGFLHALAGHPRGRGTVVLVYTEFGRRVAANASAGTDHGWANVALVAGPAVKGGFYGEPPSLTKLSLGNTVYTTDFRSLYATVLADVLGVDPKPFLMTSVPNLGFVD
jgi:uncharacterized protein (DUF1501 family)